MVLKTGFLENGLAYALNKNPDYSGVVISYVVKYGKRNAPVELIELPHLLEHVVAFGGTKRISSAEVVSLLDYRYEDWEATTFNDYTIYEISASKKQYKEALDLLSEMVNYSAPSKSLILREKKRLKMEHFEEINDRLTSAEDISEDEIYGLDGSKVFYKHKIDSISRVSDSDIHSAYNDFYVPNNSLLILDGNIDINDAIHSISLKFGNLSIKEMVQQPLNYWDNPVRNRKTDEDIFVYLPGGSDKTCISSICIPLPGSSKMQCVEEFANLKLLYKIIEGRFEKFVYQNFERDPMVYSTEVQTFIDRNRSGIIILNNVLKSDFGGIKSMVVDEMCRVVDGNISKEEIMLAKRKMRRELRLRGSEPHENAENLADFFSNNGAFDHYSTMLRVANDASLKSIKETARNSIDPSGLISLFITQNKKDGTRMKTKSLESGHGGI